MKQILTYQFKLYRHKRNRHLVRQIELAARIWNHCIALHRRYYRLTGKRIHKFALHKHLVKVRRRCYPHWNGLQPKAIENICARIDEAYKLFFANLKKGKKAAPPGFCPRRLYASFTLRSCGWTVLPSPEGHPTQGRLRIGAHVYRYHKSREIPGLADGTARVKTVTVKRDRCGDLWVSLAVESAALTEAPALPTEPTAPVGFDFGLTTFLVGSDGTRHHAPEPLRRNLAQLRAHSRALSKKTLGSGNRARARLDVARLYRRIENQRRDWHRKLAAELTRRYDAIALEDLCIAGMSRRWGRKIGDLAPYAFRLRLEEATRKRGVCHVVLVDRFSPTSKTCAGCGYVIKELPLSVRRWPCPSCGSDHDRDENAARNILREGLSALALQSGESRT